LFKKITVLLLSFTFVSCASLDPSYIADVKKRPVLSKKVPDNSSGVSFLARMSIDPLYRKQLVSSFLSTTSSPDSIDVSGSGASAIAAGDLVAGEASSSLGTSMGLGVAAASALLNFAAEREGYPSMGFVSQAFIPELPNNTIDEASKYLVSRTHARIVDMVESRGWSYRCIFGCDNSETLDRLYEINPSLSGTDYMFYPKTFIAGAKSNPLEAATELDSQLPLSITPSWRTPLGDTYKVSFYTPSMPAPYTLMRDKNGAHYIEAEYFLDTTKLGRELYREFHQHGDSYFGNAYIKPYTLYHNGDIYSARSLKKAVFIDSKIIN